jgi:hypothetical protein
MGNRVALVVCLAVSILFFQASATVIPTLFIALAFTSKAFAPGENSLLEATASADVRYRVAVGFLTIPISSEAVALATLAANRPTTFAQYWVLAGITITLAYLLMSVTASSQGAGDRLTETIVWGMAMPMFVFIVFKVILENLS